MFSQDDPEQGATSKGIDDDAKDYVQQNDNHDKKKAATMRQ